MSIHRSNARKALALAQSELASADDQRLKYAALELRMAIEAVTYDRASAYKAEFPPEEYQTWQPKKIMLVLLEIDSRADSDSSLSFGIEPAPGEKPEVMKLLGSEVVFNLLIIKKHYDALGSYLHSPSLKIINSNIRFDYNKMRKRCEDIASVLVKVLASPISNITFGVFSSFDCFECNTRIRRRMPFDINSLEVDCFDCLASYTFTRLPDDQVRADPHHIDVHCANPSCGQAIIFFRREIIIGKTWTCTKCLGRNEFQLGLMYYPTT